MGRGTVAGIYFTGDSLDGEDVQQWARVKFSHGIRTVPAGSMRFVDFSKPDPAEERVERFMIAAQRAMAEGDYALAAQRLIYARDAEPRNVAVLRLMTLAFWQAGNLEAAARSVRDWARVDGDRPAPHRFAARIYEDIGADRPRRGGRRRAVERGPADAGAWERLGRLRLRLGDLEGALRALERARRTTPSVEGLLDLALARQLAGDPGGERSACEEATLLDPQSSQAWSRYAHALARSDRVSECIAACEQALELQRTRRCANCWNGAGTRSTHAAGRLAARSPQPRMFTARETIRPIVTSETSDWMPITPLAMPVSGIVSVGENAVALVSDTYR